MCVGHICCRGSERAPRHGAAPVCRRPPKACSGYSWGRPGTLALQDRVIVFGSAVLECRCREKRCGGAAGADKLVVDRPGMLPPCQYVVTAFSGGGIAGGNAAAAAATVESR
jgi:hypothetical protein